jgi:pimeloyl-ACP methyl ester carboxylesterase
MKRITRIACAVLAAVVVAGCTYRIDESNIVIARSAPPVDLSVLHAEFPGYRIEPAAITTPDGNRLQSLRFVREDAVATVLYFGGNGYTVARFAPRTLAVYRDLPVNVVLVDHRGYGGSSGTPTVETLMADAGLVHAQVRADPAFAGLPLLLHGHSLGSFMAGHVAAERPVDGVILESSVTTTEDWTAHLRSQQRWWVRALVWRVLPDEGLARMGNSRAVAALDEPALFVVGADDDVTPARFTRALFDIAPLAEDRKRLLVVPGRGHQDATDTDAFREAMAAFVEHVVETEQPTG